MNKKHTNLFPKFLLALCLVTVMVLFHAPQAYATSPTVEVSTLADLQTAIDAAADGDVIGLTATLEIESNVVIGSPDKHVTIIRMNPSAYFQLGGLDFNMRVQNITFDGNNLEANHPLFIVYSNVNFENIDFINNVSTGSGGALYVSGGNLIFTNCLFDNNRATAGGHMAISGSGNVTLENCVLRNGNAVSKGGAIFNCINSSTVNIISSVITGNTAGDYGGGVANDGALIISGTKIYNNTTSLGGADIASTGWMQTLEPIETFIELFADEGIIPTAWVTDYTDGQPYSQYLRLDYDILLPPAVILDSASLGTAGDGKISGLESGKYYKVTVDDVISYVKSDGTLTANESEAEALLGTEILGLTNGKTYKVEEYIPEPEEPVTPTEPTPDPQPQPDPEPVTPPSSNPSSGGSSHSHHSSPTVTTVVKPETKTLVVLSYGKAVLDTTKTEYLLGYADGLLGNKDTVTRAQLVQIVYRLLTPESKAAVYSEKNSFKDVASNAWYNEAVSSMANAGLISVGADGKFNPDKNVTWGEMVSILAKFAKPNSEWKIITRHWARDALNTAISYRWFEYNDQFNPDGEVTRLEMLNFINTMFNWATK